MRHAYVADLDFVLIADVWWCAENVQVSVKKRFFFASGQAVTFVLGDMDQADDAFDQSSVDVQTGKILVRKFGAARFVSSALRVALGISPPDGQSLGGSCLNVQCVGHEETD